MSDLQCPARLVVAWPRSSPEGGDDARDLVAELVLALARERVLLVYAAQAPLSDAVASGLAVPLAAATDLETVADLHRGETVLLLAEGPRVLDPVRDRLVHGPAADRLEGQQLQRQAPGWVLVRVEVDADGWVVRDSDADAPSR
jgi:hypothetical protein